MNVFRLLRRNLREFYDQYPLVGCATWVAAVGGRRGWPPWVAAAVGGFVLLLLLPPEVADLLGLLLSLLSLRGALFGGD